MSRTFAYCRCSTTEQNIDTQIEAIKSQGFDVDSHRIISEHISGSTHAMQRPEFKNLIENKLETGDTLVVLKLDRLGRDNIDVQTTVNKLVEMKITLKCLDLPTSNLSSPEGKLILQLLGTFAEFERNRIRERTREGLERAKREGKKLGRPRAAKTYNDVQKLKEAGLTQSLTAGHLGISIRTVKRHWSMPKF